MIWWILGILLAAVLNLAVGAVWYGALFGGAAAALHPGYAVDAAPSAGVVAGEALRGLVLATGLAALIAWTGASGAWQVIGLAVLVWAGFQLGGFAGSVLHEGYPLRLYAIHMGDALLKAVVASFVIAGLAGRLT